MTIGEAVALMESEGLTSAEIADVLKKDLENACEDGTAPLKCT